MKDDIGEINKKIEESTEEKEQLQRQLNAIYDNVAEIVRLFKRSKFSLYVATRMDYDIGSGFTESNVTQYLAELEEYISNLITYISFKKSDEFAAIAAVPLERLTKPRDKKDIIAIDAPTANEINYDKINMEDL